MGCASWLRYQMGSNFWVVVGFMITFIHKYWKWYPLLQNHAHPVYAASPIWNMLNNILILVKFKVGFTKPSFSKSYAFLRWSWRILLTLLSWWSLVLTDSFLITAKHDLPHVVQKRKTEMHAGIWWDGKAIPQEWLNWVQWTKTKVLILK